MPRLPEYDRLGWPAHDGTALDDAGAMQWWEEARERVLTGNEAPDEADDAGETHPCAMDGCPHLAHAHAFRCPIHAKRGEYYTPNEPWQERIW
jgi:hypothetical protein